MPKKTKREKIIAEYRRKIHVLSTTQHQTRQDVTSTPAAQKDSQYTFEQPKSVISGPVEKKPATLSFLIPNEEYAGIRKSIVKTLFISFAALLFELMIWKVTKL